VNILAKKDKDEILRYFNEKLAVKIGVYEAIVIQQIEYWIKSNEKKSVNFHDGHYWTFNSIEDWSVQFPFWSPKTTKRLLKQLRDDEYLITTNAYNRRKADKTLWYRINYDKLSEILGDSLTPSKGPVCPQETIDSMAQVVPDHQPSLTPTQGQVVPSDRDSLTPTLPIVSNSYTITTNSFPENETVSLSEKEEPKETVNIKSGTRAMIEITRDMHPGLTIWDMACSSSFRRHGTNYPIIKVNSEELPEITRKLEQIWPTINGPKLKDKMTLYIEDQLENRWEPDLLTCINFIIAIPDFGEPPEPEEEEMIPF